MVHKYRAKNETGNTIIDSATFFMGKETVLTQPIISTDKFTLRGFTQRAKKPGTGQLILNHQER